MSALPDVTTPLPGLFQRANSDLYRANAFRVAGLSVEATARDVARHFERLRLARRWGKAAAPRGPFDLPAPPGPELVREAQHRLRDPESRFLDEFFWFWPEALGRGGRGAPAAAPLGTPEAARAAWEHAARSPGEGGWALHNLAVLAHLRALDLEHRALADPGRLPPPEAQERAALWPQAWQHWRALLADEPVWRDLALRVRELGEPQLTVAAVEGLRTHLPEALLAVNGHLAVRAGEQGLEAEVARHAGLMQGSGFDAAAVDAALARAVQPVCERIKLLCRKAADDTAADPAQGFPASMRLQKFATAQLAVLDKLLPARHALRVGMRDEVALQMVEILIRYSQKTRTCDSALWFQFGKALSLASSPSARAQVEANVKVIQEACGIPAWLKADRHGAR
jgi:hypothetical protein